MQDYKAIYSGVCLCERIHLRLSYCMVFIALLSIALRYKLHVNGFFFSADV